MTKRRSQYTYGNVPLLHHARSKFDLSYDHKTTGNVGDLLPVYVQEIAPGDSFKCDASVVIRTTTPFIKPVMDNLFCDLYFFFVPSRTIYNKWAEIFGENNQGAWARPSLVSAPQLAMSGDDNLSQPFCLSSYLGVPVGTREGTLDEDGGISVLPFRAYAKIYNEWFRDENLIDPVNVQIGETVPSESINSEPFSPTNYTGRCAKVAKLHDFFTQLAPAPQKGDPVQIGTAIFPQSSFPVVTSASPVVNGVHSPITFNQASDGSVPAGQRYFELSSGAGVYSSDVPSGSFVGSLYPSNLQVNVGETELGSVSVNDLRYAFQLQKMLERDAIFGTRYTEYLQGHFGVNSPDARLQRSEFLGGRRFPLSILQATQMSQTSSDSPLGQVAGWSLSNGRAGYTKGFTEHGFVIGMLCVRQFHTYQQGIERFLSRKNRVDFLDPLFATVGYQPVFTKEIFADVNNADTVFGYAPAYEDMRCRQNRISGQLATAAGEGLDIWHFGDNYRSVPVLGQEFIEETSIYVDRALSASSDIIDNFIIDCYFKQYGIRVLPTYGMPGLIDHH